MGKLNPWYITGFIEGEGCFAITISKHKTKKLGVDARLIFEVELRIDDRPILEKLQKILGCGNIYTFDYQKINWNPHVKFYVHSFRDLEEKVIPFFKKYPFQGRKAKDFELFCQAAEIFKKKEHLTPQGIEKLKKLRSGMNKRRPVR